MHQESCWGPIQTPAPRPTGLAQTSWRCSDALSSALPRAPRPRQTPHGHRCVPGAAALPRLHPAARGLVAWDRAENSSAKPSESSGVLTGVRHGTARSGATSSQSERGLAWAGRGGAGCLSRPPCHSILLFAFMTLTWSLLLIPGFHPLLFNCPISRMGSHQPHPVSRPAVATQRCSHLDATCLLPSGAVFELLGKKVKEETEEGFFFVLNV